MEFFLQKNKNKNKKGMELLSNYFTRVLPCLFITINWFIGHRSLILCKTKDKIISICSEQKIKL